MISVGDLPFWEQLVQEPIERLCVYFSAITFA